MDRLGVYVRGAVAALLALGVGTIGRVAAAQPATANVIQFGAGAQYGVNLKSTKPNPWGLGLGLGVGYTLPSGLYGGAQFEYFFGGQQTISVGNETETWDADVEANIWDLFAEVGYDLALGDEFVLRGKGDVGLASFSSKLCFATPPGVETFPCEDDSENALLVGPGAAFLYLGKAFSLTFETRYDFILTSPNQQGLIFTLGLGF